MMKTVARSYGWASPSYLNEMYCDDEDILGIGFWYNDVKDQHREMEKKTK